MSLVTIECFSPHIQVASTGCSPFFQTPRPSCENLCWSQGDTQYLSIKYRLGWSISATSSGTLEKLPFDRLIYVVFVSLFNSDELAMGEPSIWMNIPLKKMSTLPMHIEAFYNPKTFHFSLPNLFFFRLRLKCLSHLLLLCPLPAPSWTGAHPPLASHPSLGVGWQSLGWGPTVS